MKKIMLFACAFLATTSGFCQKSKTPKVSYFAKTDNLTLETKSSNFQITIEKIDKTKDTIFFKKVAPKFQPTDCTIKPFIADGVPLYLVSWKESTQTKTDLKKEDKVFSYSFVYDISTKKKIFVNNQTKTHIVEKVFLDRLKNASETQERNQSEGFEFLLNPDGSIALMSKSKVNKYTFKKATMLYTLAKK